MAMTRDEFIKFWSSARGAEYATKAGWKRDGYMERMAVPCNGECDYGDCQGWIMTSAAPEDAAFYAITNPQFADWIPEHIRDSEAYKRELADWKEIAA